MSQQPLSAAITLSCIFNGVFIYKKDVHVDVTVTKSGQNQMISSEPTPSLKTIRKFREHLKDSHSKPEISSNHLTLLLPMSSSSSSSSSSSDVTSVGGQTRAFTCWVCSSDLHQ